MDATTGKPLVDVILDAAGSKGTGVWTVQTALDLGVPISGIAEAVFARSLSSKAEQRKAARELPGPAETFTVTDEKAFIEDVRQALYASKIVAYSQGFDAIVAGAAAVRLGHQEGRHRRHLARRLHHPRPVPEPDHRGLRGRPGPGGAADRAITSARRWAVHRTRGGGSLRWLPPPASPSPAFSSSLAYYDGLRAERLPAALVQGQRDFFGAHTYQRADKPGTFHTLWSGDRTEIETEGSSH